MRHHSSLHRHPVSVLATLILLFFLSLSPLRVQATSSRTVPATTTLPRTTASEETGDSCLVSVDETYQRLLLQTQQPSSRLLRQLFQPMIDHPCPGGLQQPRTVRRRAGVGALAVAEERARRLVAAQRRAVDFRPPFLTPERRPRPLAEESGESACGAGGGDGCENLAAILAAAHLL